MTHLENLKETFDAIGVPQFLKQTMAMVIIQSTLVQRKNKKLEQKTQDQAMMYSLNF